jgi:hypothetical protein
MHAYVPKESKQRKFQTDSNRLRSWGCDRVGVTVLEDAGDEYGLDPADSRAGSKSEL